MRTLLLVLPLLAPAPVLARSAPVLDSAVFVERSGPAGASQVHRLQPDSPLLRGDRVVTVLRWQQAAAGYKVTSAVPPRLHLQSASSERVEVSLDGGRSWLVPADADALPPRITHLRWQLGSGPGSLTYRAVVR